MLNDPRSQEIEAGEHQGQRKKDGNKSSGQNSGSEVGGEATSIHEKTGTKNEWEAAPGLQDCRAPLSASVTSPEAAQTAVEPKLTAAQKQKRLDFAKVRINWSIHHWRRVLFIDESSFGLFHTVTLLFHPPNHRHSGTDDLQNVH